MQRKYIRGLIAISVLSLSSYSSLVSAEWHFGIGTGLATMDMDGDLSIDTTLAGPQKFKVDLSPAEFNDVLDGAIGFGGYASDGTWTYQYSYKKLDLEGNDNSGVVRSDIELDLTEAEFIASYPLYRSPSIKLSVIGGLVYTKHEFSAVLISGATKATNDKDNSWTDVALGGTMDLPFGSGWNWNTRLDGQFGDSEGNFNLQTGLGWHFLTHWSAGVFVRYQAVDFKNGSSGSSDFYQWDVDQTTLGANFLYHW